jgi:hypothetical protein
MKAAEFNGIYDRVLVQPLLAAGFVQHGPSLFFFEDSGVLSLLRHQNKWSSLTQSTLFTVCIRHHFLRDLERQPCERLSRSINDYPFKIQPSKLRPDFLRSGWHYEPCNLGHWPEDRIEYGNAAASDVTSQLEGIRDSVYLVGLPWLRFLVPVEARNQILKYGESAYCEKIWLEDYERFIADQGTMARGSVG